MQILNAWVLGYRCRLELSDDEREMFVRAHE